MDRIATRESKGEEGRRGNSGRKTGRGRKRDHINRREEQDWVQERKGGMKEW